MKAIEFLEEYRRMCNSYIDHFMCEGCPLKGKQCLGTGVRFKTDSEYLTIISTVEQWSKEHPIITNACKFKEVFGFLPEGCQTFYFVKPNGSYSKTINWQDQYKEPEYDE